MKYFLGDSMKLNNKGMTLIELLVSIVIIGIILTFLFQLLNDLDHETNNNNYAYNNQVNRIDAIYAVQKDLQQYTLVGVENASKENNITINFHFQKEGGEIFSTLYSDPYEYTDELGNSKTKYYLRYTSYSGEKYSWEMKGATLDTCVTFNYYENNSSNKDRNNVVDDIEIVYSGNKNDLKSDGKYLTGNNEYKGQIGNCAN